MQPFASVALTVIGNVPACVGVPLNTPVDELSVMPAGNAPVSLHVIVPMPPDCVNAWLKAMPTVPVLVTGAVTVIVWQLTLSVKLALVVVPQLSVACTVMTWLPDGPAFVIATTPLALTVGAVL